MKTFLTLGTLLNFIAITSLWIIIPYWLALLWGSSVADGLFIPIILIMESMVVIPTIFIVTYLFIRHRRNISNHNIPHIPYSFEIASLASGLLIGTVTATHANFSDSFFAGLLLNRGGIVEYVEWAIFPLYYSIYTYTGVKLSEIVFSKFTLHKLKIGDIIIVLFLITLSITPLLTPAKTVDSFINNYLEDQQKKIESELEIHYNSNSDFTLKGSIGEIKIPIKVYIPLDGFYQINSKFITNNQAYTSTINKIKGDVSQQKTLSEKLDKGHYTIHYQFINLNCKDLLSGPYNLNFEIEWNTKKTRGTFDRQITLSDYSFKSDTQIDKKCK